MNVEAYDLDTLRGMVRDLLEENRQLREMLREKGIIPKQKDCFSREEIQKEECFPDQGERILPFSVNREMANRFFSRFWGRTDVYAKRGSKGGYFPQCANRWNETLCPKARKEKQACEDCENRKWKPLSVEVVMDHLLGRREDGSDAIGVYPLFPDNTCRFLVFDFDNHEAKEEDFANADESWREEVGALRKICEQNQVPVLVERSRSGRGAHVWILFTEPVPASMARNFGFLLLEQGAGSVNLPSFRYYDRMFPTQDTLSSLGNLIALPLQGRPLLQGNSAFVDEAWNAYPRQLEVLFSLERLSLARLGEIAVKWAMEKSQTLPGPTLLGETRPMPWRKKEAFQKTDVTGVLHLVLANGIYVDALNVKPRLLNQLRCMATIDNPQFYKNKNSGRSNYATFRTIYMGKDVEGYVRLPRGLWEELVRRCEEAQIPYEVEDRRQTGRPIRVRLKRKLGDEQEKAVEAMLSYETGILNSATGSGKTTESMALIAHRRVSTLILVESKAVMKQWLDSLQEVLEFDESPPTYETAKGRTRTRESVIGVLGSGKDTTGGIVDVAMVSTACRRESFLERLGDYGMVICDECHHLAAASGQTVLEQVSSKYVYGVTATVERSDNLEKMVLMQLGAIRHVYSARDFREKLGMQWYIIPRFTRLVSFETKEQSYQEIVDWISEDAGRNEMILKDIREALSLGRTPLVLTQRRKHAKFLYDALQGETDHVFTMSGDYSDKVNQQTRERMKEVPLEEKLILVATGKMVGEGYDFPRFDTLFLVGPIRFDGLLGQYLGRLMRKHEGKEEVLVYDYVDGHIPLLHRQYLSRLRYYRKEKFRILSAATEAKQEAQGVYGKWDYLEVFERDLVEEERQVLIASPELTGPKVDRLLDLMKPRMEAGVKVTVLTLHPDEVSFGDSSAIWELHRRLQEAGVLVRTSEEETERFAVLGQSLVWYGGVNLLGQEDAWDSILRVHSTQTAAELMELAFGKVASGEEEE